MIEITFGVHAKFILKCFGKMAKVGIAYPITHLGNRMLFCVKHLLRKVHLFRQSILRYAFPKYLLETFL